MTGEMLNDREQLLAGILPGWLDNQQFADNIIDLVTAYVRDRSPYSAIKLYELFSDLETRLGQLVQSVLISHSQNSDFSALIPESVRKKLRSASGFDYSRATYMDLVVILETNSSSSNTCLIRGVEVFLSCSLRLIRAREFISLTRIRLLNLA